MSRDCALGAIFALLGVVILTSILVTVFGSLGLLTLGSSAALAIITGISYLTAWVLWMMSLWFWS